MATLAKLLVGLGLDATEYDKGLDQAESKADGFGTKIGGFLGGAMKLGLAATAGGVVAAIGGIVKGVASNAEFERYQTQFGVLLGSTDKAKARLEDLAKFGATTPFELPELVQADKILVGFGLDTEETAKKWGRSGAEIRTIVGDVASGTGASFQEMSLLLGKFSAGATGEAISRMAELGIASRDDLKKMGLEFDKSGALLSPLPKAMDVVLSLMKDKYGGMMDAQSMTFEGMISNLQDWVSGTLRTLSAPIFDVVKDKLGALLKFLSDPATMAALNSFANTLASGVGAAMDFLSNTAIPALIAAWQSIQPVIATVISIFEGLHNVLVFGEFDLLYEALYNAFGPEVAGMLTDWAAWFSEKIPLAIQATVDIWNNQLYPALQAIGSFISNNIKPIMAGLAAIIVAVVVPAFIAWATAAIASATATIVALAPVLIPLALLGAAVALLYAAWDSNFLGIRDVLIDVWQNYLLPAFTAVKDWLSVFIPAAIAVVSSFWSNTLLPALSAVWSFIQNYVIPIFIAIVQTHIAAMKIAVQSLATFWTTILWPALQKVWQFLNTYIIPVIVALVRIHIAALKLAVQSVAAFFSNILWPALQKVWAFLNTYLNPILTYLYDVVVNKGLKPALQAVAFFILGTLIPQFIAVKSAVVGTLNPALDTAKGVLGKVADAFHAIDDAIRGTIKWIQEVADKLSSISIPDWLQGHSPPPMAHWFDYIGQAARFANNEFDTFNRQMMNGQIGSPIVPMGINGNAANMIETGPQLSITANYAHQEERTLRDEIRMQAMLLGINPTG